MAVFHYVHLTPRCTYGSRLVLILKPEHIVNIAKYGSTQETGHGCLSVETMYTQLLFLTFSALQETKRESTCVKKNTGRESFSGQSGIMFHETGEDASVRHALLKHSCCRDRICQLKLVHSKKKVVRLRVLCT